MEDLIQNVVIGVLALWATAERLITVRRGRQLEERDNIKMADYARMYENVRRELTEHIKSRLHGR